MAVGRDVFELCARFSAATQVAHLFLSTNGECRDIDNCNRPTGLSCEGERWSADECGSGVHVVQGSSWRGCLGRSIACSKNVVGFRGRLPPVGVLCVSTCVSKMPLAAALKGMFFSDFVRASRGLSA